MLLAFLVTLFAGLATALGAVLAVTGRGSRPTWFGVALAFAAGAMLMLVFGDLVPDALSALSAKPMAIARLLLVGAAAGGFGAVWWVDRRLPRVLQRFSWERLDPLVSESDRAQRAGLLRSGVMVAVVLALHSFPEGIAAFLTTLADPAAGVAMAGAIALHNLPEGVAIAAPIYGATGSKRLALSWATLAGLAEALGGLAGIPVASWSIPAEVRGLFAGGIAGMLLFLTFKELLPGALRAAPARWQVAAGLGGGLAMVGCGLLLGA